MYERILVPVDGSPTSTLGLDEAIKLAKLTGASIRLVGMLREAGEKILGDAKARCAASGIAATAFLCDTFGSRVCDLVVDQARAWRADVIVIGSHGRRGMSRIFLGSDAEMVIRTAPVPVLVVRGSGDAAAHATSDAAASPRSAVPA